MKFKPGQTIKWVSFNRGRKPEHTGTVLACIPAGQDLCPIIVQLGLRYTRKKSSSLDVAKRDRYLIREETSGLITAQSNMIDRRAVAA